MGITHLSLDRINRYLEPHMKMLELGAQNLYDTEHYGWIAKDYFEAIPIQHISVDIIQYQGCVECDLRQLHPFRGNDIVTNMGTLEHVDGPLFIPFKNIHNACVVDGIMIHENPRFDHWPLHGQHYFSMDFYKNFSEACGYEILELCEEPAMGNYETGMNVCCVMRKSLHPFVTKNKFNEIYAKHIFAR